MGTVLLLSLLKIGVNLTTTQSRLEPDSEMLILNQAHVERGHFRKSIMNNSNSVELRMFHLNIHSSFAVKIYLAQSAPSLLSFILSHFLMH